MVECTGLENRNPGNWIEGSNPSLSAKSIGFARLFSFCEAVLPRLLPQPIVYRADNPPPVLMIPELPAPVGGSAHIMGRCPQLAPHQ